MTAAVIALALGACEREAEGEFDTSLTLEEVMAHMIEPAAREYWSRTGEVADEGGWHSRAPIDPDAAPGTWGTWNRRVALEMDGTGTRNAPEALTEAAARELALAEWEAASSGAITLVQASNILRLPAYVRKVETDDNGDYLKFVEQMNAKAHEALEAADAREADRMFEIGGELYQICTACHAKYVTPFQAAGSEPLAPP